MKYVILTVGLFLVLISAQATGDQLFHFYYEYNQAKYFLSAPYGGGDELVSKKLTQEPQDYETFHLEFVPTKNKEISFYRIKTFRNYYVSLTKDGELMAEEKDADKAHLFFLKKEITRTDQTKVKGNQAKRTWMKVVLGRQAYTQLWFLTFDKAQKELVMDRGLLENAPKVMGQMLNVEITTNNFERGAGYKVKWRANLDYYSYAPKPESPVFLMVKFGQAGPGKRPVKNFIWRTDKELETVVHDENLNFFTLSLHPKMTRPQEFKYIELWKNAKFYKRWKVHRTIRPGQEVLFYMSGKIIVR